MSSQRSASISLGRIPVKKRLEVRSVNDVEAPIQLVKRLENDFSLIPRERIDGRFLVFQVFELGRGVAIDDRVLERHIKNTAQRYQGIVPSLGAGPLDHIDGQTKVAVSD